VLKEICFVNVDAGPRSSRRPTMAEVLYFVLWQSHERVQIYTTMEMEMKKGEEIYAGISRKNCKEI
jgi:hypothetical protein